MENVNKGQNDNELTLVIKSTSGNWTCTYSKTAKVQDVINGAVAHFSFATNGKYELVLESKPDETLKPERTLVSYHISDGDVLVLIDFGAAV